MISHDSISHGAAKHLKSRAKPALEQHIENQLLLRGIRSICGASGPGMRRPGHRGAGGLVNRPAGRKRGFPGKGGQALQEGERSHTDPIFCNLPYGSTYRYAGSGSARPWGQGCGYE
ncbi:hypothetical protein IWQ51_001724 [Labrenzia sp. EL_142]|nr:hypothetical protein [Labrenzia sp. EL_142]